MNALESWNSVSNYAKATKAEALIGRLGSLPLNEEGKEALKYAEWILAEVRHAAACALAYPGDPINERNKPIADRLWGNVIKS